MHPHYIVREQLKMARINHSQVTNSEAMFTLGTRARYLERLPLGTYMNTPFLRVLIPNTHTTSAHCLHQDLVLESQMKLGSMEYSMSEYKTTLWRCPGTRGRVPCVTF